MKNSILTVFFLHFLASISCIALISCKENPSDVLTSQEKEELEETKKKQREVANQEYYAERVEKFSPRENVECYVIPRERSPRTMSCVYIPVVTNN